MPPPLFLNKTQKNKEMYALVFHTANPYGNLIHVDKTEGQLGQSTYCTTHTFHYGNHDYIVHECFYTLDNEISTEVKN